MSHPTISIVSLAAVFVSSSYKPSSACMRDETKRTDYCTWDTKAASLGDKNIDIYNKTAKTKATYIVRFLDISDVQAVLLLYIFVLND